MSRLMKKMRLSRSGMTMVEVVVSALIMALAALILSSAFGSALKVLRRGADYQSAGNSAFTVIEGDTATGEDGDMTFNGFPPVPGKFYSQEEEENGVVVKFYSFEPDE